MAEVVAEVEVGVGIGAEVGLEVEVGARYAGRKDERGHVHQGQG